MQNFDLNNVELRFSEVVGLNLCFYEQKIRGSEEVSCIVEATEYGDGVDVSLPLSFDSWEKMKKTFPDLHSMLDFFSHDIRWEASWRDNDRILFIESLEGHTGLYDTDQVVYLDLQAPNTNANAEKETETKKVAKKKAKKN